MSGAAVLARGLGVVERGGPVFRGVDADVPAGGLLVVRGPARSGRTSLLLTLAGRMAFTEGDLVVDGHRLPEGADAVR